MDIVRAVSRNDVEAVRRLLNDGADVNSINTEERIDCYWIAEKGDTLLHISVKNENVELTKLLLQRGANVHALDSGNEPAICRSSYDGNTEITKMLIEAGADPKYRNKDGRSLFHINSDNPCADFIEFILQYIPERINEIDKEGNTFLHNACISCGSDYYDEIKLLCKKGANANILNKEDYTPLFFTVKNRCFELTHLLLQHGANPNLTGRYSRRLLSEAFQDENVLIAWLLVEYGAHIVCPETGENLLEDTWGMPKSSVEFIKMIVANKNRDRRTNAAMAFLYANEKHYL